MTTEDAGHLLQGYKRPVITTLESPDPKDMLRPVQIIAEGEVCCDAWFHYLIACGSDLLAIVEDDEGNLEQFDTAEFVVQFTDRKG